MQQLLETKEISKWRPECKDCDLPMVHDPEATIVSFSPMGMPACRTYGEWQCPRCDKRLPDYEITEADKLKPLKI